MFILAHFSVSGSEERFCSSSSSRKRKNANKESTMISQLHNLNKPTMKHTIFCSVVLVFVISTLFLTAVVISQAATRQDIHRRVKRALYELPDGSELIVGPNIKTTFNCDGLGYGYYADLDNDCKIFHICQSFKMSDGSIYNNHWSFMCGNQTVFNQVSLACSHPEDAVPCENAKDFYYVNDYFGDLQAPSVKEQDLNSAHELISRAYGSRISSSTPASAAAAAATV